MKNNIRDVLVPFVTDLGTAKIHRLDQLCDDDVLLRMSMTKVIGTIYDDQNNKVSVPAWTYNTTVAVEEGTASFPSTGLVVRKNQSLQVEWHNDTAEHELSPVDEVIVPYNDEDSQVPQNNLGTNDQVLQPKPKARFITHLHGGRVAPSYDGWAENVAMPGQALRDWYENNERATMHWFHDHAMHTTAGNVFAGLAAPYIIRDDEENALELPDGEDELVLVIQDRNISASITEIQNAFNEPSGAIETNFLRKVEKAPGPLEFFGPLTLVNGKVWPYKSVPAKWQRFRLLNGSNSRTYAIRFVATNEQGQVALHQVEDKENQAVDAVDIPVLQIGADGGLLDKSIDLQGKSIILMPAQRVDLLVDFSDFADQKIALINLATAPFGGDIRDLSDAFPSNPENDKGRTPYPEVMRFDIQNIQGCFKDYKNIDEILATYVNLDCYLPYPKAVTVDRVIGLLEKNMGDGKAMLVTLELVPTGSLPEYQVLDSQKPFHPKPPYQVLFAGREVEIDGIPYRVCAERFQDPVNFQVKYGATERWRFVNLSPDSHPMHLHLVQFLHEKTTVIDQITGFDLEIGDTTLKKSDPDFSKRLAGFVNGAFVRKKPVTITLGKVTEKIGNNINDDLPNVLRDTVRIDPGTVVDIIARFEGYHGRYLYHCHILEHEDHDMMRQYVIARSDLDGHHMSTDGHHMSTDGHHMSTDGHHTSTDILPIMGSLGK